MKRKLLFKTIILATMLCIGKSAWAYSSQRVYQDWGRGDNANFNGSALSWTKLSGSNGLTSPSSAEIVWDGTSSNYVHTIYNSSAYCPMENILPTLNYSDSYTVSFFFKAKAKGAFQYAVYKKGVTPTSTMLTADQVIFSIECTSAASTTSDEAAMTPSINRSATTVSITGQVYYQVVLTVNSTNATYYIYPINTTGSTPYSVDTANPVATGTLSTGDMGGLYLNANNSAQTMRFDDIMVDFMPNEKTVKTITTTNTTTTNGLNAAAGKYYERYTISATDYNDAAIDNSDLTISQANDTYADLSDNLLSFKGIGTSTVIVNNKSLDIENTVAYLKAASWDLTQQASLVTDNSHELRKNNAYFYGFGVSGNNIERYCWQRYSGSNWGNSQVEKWILNGFKSTATTNNYWQFHPNYGVNVTNNTTLTAQTPIDDMYLKLSLKKNTGEASGDGTAVYAATPTTYSWTKSSSATFETRDNKVVYTGLDVYIPDGTTVTPTTINNTYNIGTFSYPYALDFSGLTTMTAWKATSATSSVINMEQVTGIVPAGTALILRGTAEAIPVANEPGTTITNLLKPVLDNDVSKTVSAATGGSTNFVLSVQSGNVVFAPINANTASVPYGKAYLNGTISLTAPALTISFGDETTGINNVNRETITNNRYFDLQGRKVVNPTKGLYIVNGKKIIIK